MKHLIKHIIYIIPLAFLTSLEAQNNTDLFKQGNALYNEGKYAEAIDKYEVILENGKHSSELYFNLANANYKLNNIAPSIYYYEKALQLNPNDAEIKNNLGYANNMTVDAIDTIPEVGFTKYLNTATRTLSFDDWALLTITLVIVFVLLFITYYFSYSESKKRFAFIASILSLTLACIALSFTFHSYNLFKNNNPAIVFAEESEIRIEPNFRSEEAFRLHEGTKVQVLDTVNNWKKIKLADGKTGWIAKNEIKMLKDDKYLFNKK